MDYLELTKYFDYQSPEIQSIIEEFRSNKLTDKQTAIGVYLKVRDNWRYNPYNISLNPDHYKASHIAKKSDGHCIDKSILLVACLRGLKIPARIHLAKVKNHIGVERFIEKYGTNEISPHGMVDLYLEGRWLKVSPAFNVELCHKCNVAPLDFDGENDSLFQQYDMEGNQFMEYLEDYGYFEDLPMDFIFENFKSNFPAIFEKHGGNGEFMI